MMRRRPDAFVTVLANRLASLAADARDAERSEHLGRYDEANEILISMDHKMRVVVAAFATEMDVRQISQEFLDMRLKR